jgi:hypothetical protein
VIEREIGIMQNIEGKAIERRPNDGRRVDRRIV